MTLRDREFMSMVDRNNCLLTRLDVDVDSLTYVLENMNQMLEQLHRRVKRFEDVKNDSKVVYMNYAHQESKDSE